MQIFNFKIADLTFGIRTDWPVEVGDNFAPFLLAEDASVQEVLQLTELPQLPVLPAPESWMHGVGETTLDGKRCVLHRLSDQSEPYLMEVYQTPCDRLLCYNAKCNERPLSMQKVFNNMELEALLLKYDALILHSSFIRWQGCGILFSAPSGTGKSTQADLWAKYKNAEILNGDRSILRKKDGRWTAYGLPFAGSSDIFRNESAPIRTIVMLEQAPENSISRLNPAQAIRRMMPEVTLHHWDPAFMNKGLDLILEVLGSVPVYLLRCLPDEGAVNLLHDTITREVLP